MLIKTLLKSLQLLTLLVIPITLGACSCRPQTPRDPLERINRGIYAFNKGLDKIAIKPVARAYEALLPKPLQRMVGNFFQNLSEIPNVANDVLQGNFAYARHDAARLVLNTTWGFGGLFDAAARGNLSKRNQDFGLTLARWGYKKSTYWVLPILGPSTFRDALGFGVNYYMWPPAYLSSDSIRYGLIGVNYIQTRAALLKAEPAISEAADEYIFIRDAYLQNRQYKIQAENTTNLSTGSVLDEPPE